MRRFPPARIFGLLLAVILVPFSAARGANTIHVPTDQPTIQAAINAASNGDTVLVAPGTYPENINFMGKAITVTSSAGPQTTIINGGQLGVVVTFNTGEGLTSVLNGFTITEGFPTPAEGYDGGGILASGTSPTITNNIITNNQACEGAGIAIFGGSPLVQGNTISHNVQGGCTGGTTGGGVEIEGGSPQIIGNVISNNSIELNGGGIGIFGGGIPVIRGNLITGNSSETWGGGIGTVNDVTLLVIENIIVGNTAPSGGGVYCSVPNDPSSGCFLTNNTVTSNSSSSPGTEVDMTGFYTQSQLVNNIIFGVSSQAALFCDTTYGATSAIVDFNDVFNSGGGQAYGGGCAGDASSKGNISADPLFFSASNNNFHVQFGSPVIGAGSISAPDLPSTDFDGNPRTRNGTVDMGAYEYFPATMTVSSTSLTFGPTPFGTTSPTQPLMITNTGSTSLLLALVTSGEYTETDNCGSVVAAGAACTANIAFVPTAVGTQAGSLTVASNAITGPVTIALTGVATGPNVLLSPTSLNFGNELEGTTSAPQTVTINNIGNLPLVISGLTVSAGFTQTNTCSAPVPASFSCSVSVSFAPTATGGYVGSLTLVDNAPGTPQTVGLTGTGYVYPTPQINPPLQPDSAAPGSGAFTLTVYGSGFFAASMVQWNQSPLATTLVSATQLTAQVPASNVMTAGTALVTVVNPTPGGGTSNATPFEITTSTPTLAFVKTDFTVGEYPEALAEGDFNGDGKPDLVVANYASSTVSVLLGNGDGTFQPHVDYATGEGPYGVVVADFNNDGKLDLAVVNTGCPLYGVCGSPSFSIFLGNGDGTFQAPRTTYLSYIGWALAAGDFNRDGKIDLALSVQGPQGGAVQIFLGNGNGTFQTGGLYLSGPEYSGAGWSIVVGDFNRDGKLDLAVAEGYPSSGVAVLLGNGDGTFQTEVEYPTGGYPNAVIAGDFNGDGILDLATANSEVETNTVSVLIGNGDGTFQTHVDYATGITPISLTAADINGDGYLDLAVTDYNADTVSVLLGNGDGTFQEHQDFPTGVGPIAVVAADFNGDGRMDLATANSLDNNVSVLLQGPLPVASPSPTTLTFTGQPVGSTSSAQTVTFSNTGTAPLTITSIAASGDFGQTNTCGTSVAAGANCTISVTFTPTAAGTRTGTLTVTDNNNAVAGSTQTVTLSGTGVELFVHWPGPIVLPPRPPSHPVPGQPGL